MPIISFIIAVYNNERFLPNAVSSILSQKIAYPEMVEVIIVDDGSTDDTPAIADRLSNVDDRVSVIHQQNQWIYASFNNGIKAARGEYIYILNSDDLLEEGAVEILIKKIQEYSHPDVIWTKVIWQDVDSNQTVIREWDLNKDVIDEEYTSEKRQIHARWLFLQKSLLAMNQANLYKRELMEKHPFRNDYYGADTLFNLSIADDISSMLVLKDRIYRYLAYGSLDLNASVEKYYGYEHEMFNEILESELRLFEKWDCDREYFSFIVLKRLINLSFEVKSLGFKNCNLPINEKVDRIFGEIADPWIREYAREVKREREYESRILTGTRTLLSQINVPDNVLPEYARILIKGLPDDYRDNPNYSELDKKMIDKAICDERNRDAIGRIYYTQTW